MINYSVNNKDVCLREINGMYFNVSPNKSYGKGDSEIILEKKSEKGALNRKLLHFLKINDYKNILSCIIEKGAHPWKVNLELTSNCNYKCKHCYIYSVDVQMRTTGDVIELIDYLKEHGVLWLQLTGGECSIRKDFIDIYKYAKECGFIVSFNTNGSNINKEIVDLLVKYPPRVVEISLYGYSEDSYQNMVGDGSQHKKVLNGIEYLMANNINVSVLLVITSLNYYDCEKMVEFCISSGVDYNITKTIIPKLNGDIYNKIIEIKSPKDEYAEVCGYYNFYKNNLKYMADLRKKTNAKKMRFCSAGYLSYYISSDLMCMACCLGRENAYKITYNEDVFKKVSRIRRGFLATSEECFKCESLMICSICKYRKRLSRNCYKDIMIACEKTKKIGKLLDDNNEGCDDNAKIEKIFLREQGSKYLLDISALRSLFDMFQICGP